jgi:hypothetical protein
VCKRKIGTNDRSCLSRNAGGSSEDWLTALNDARKRQVEAIDGTFNELKWSNDLQTEAQAWANIIAANCRNGVPVAEANPKDYGVATILNMRNPQMAVSRWVTNGKRHFKEH